MAGCSAAGWSFPKPAAPQTDGRSVRPVQAIHDAIVVAVAHRQFIELGYDGIRRFGRPNLVIYDIKHVLPKDRVDGRL